MSEAPDFVGMIQDGMSISERERQLRYETDEDGNVVLDKDSKPIPRSSFPLRKYAMDQRGPVKIGESVVQFWKTDQLIPVILKKEKEAGLLVDDRKGKGRATKASQKEEQQMAEAQRKKIMLRRNSEAESTEKEDKTPRKVKNKGAKVSKIAEAPAKTGKVLTGGKKRMITTGGTSESAGKTEKGGGGDKRIAALEAKFEEFEQTLLNVHLPALHDVLLQKLNELAASLSVFQGPTTGKGKAKEPKLDYQNLLNQEPVLNLASYLEGSSTTAEEDEDEDEADDADDSDDEEEEDDDEGEEDEEDDE